MQWSENLIPSRIRRAFYFFFFYWYTLCLYTGSVFRTEKSPERPTNLLRSSGKKRQFFKNKLTWQVDTHMVLSQTKYILIPHHAMHQILHTGSTILINKR